MNIKISKYIFLSSFLMLLISLAFSQEASPQPPYIIRKTHYNIKGFVTIAALKNKIELQEGLKFESIQSLTKYILDRRTVLINLDALSGTMSTILFSHEWNQELAQYDVDVYVYVTAGLTFFVLPYFKYSTDGGLTLAARIRDYNFLGSLDTLKINVDYNLNFDGGENPFQTLSSSVSTTYPFQIGKHGLNLSLSEAIEYKIGEYTSLQNFDLFAKDFKNNFDIELNYSYPLLQRLNYQASIAQAINTQIDTFGSRKYSYGSSKIQTGISFLLNRTPNQILGNMSYSPYINYQQEYPIGLSEFNPVLSDDPNVTRSNGIPGVGHGISLGSVSKIPSGFFRKGISANLDNRAAYNIRLEGWETSISTEAQAHFLFWNRMGISLRGYGSQLFYYYPDNINTTGFGSDTDERLRGVLSGEYGNAWRYVAFNTDLLINLFQMRINRLLSAEMHMGPLLDIVVRQRVADTFNADEDIKVTTGFELLAHHIYYSGIRIRGSYGFDLSKTIKNNAEGAQSIPGGIWSNKEISIGLNLFY